MKSLNKYLEKNTLSPQALHELVKILFYQPVNATNHTIAVFITTWFLWGTVSHTLIIIWAVFMLLQTAFWVLLVETYKKRQPTVEEAPKWIRAFPIAAFGIGIGWGVIAFWPGLLEDFTTTVFVSIMVIGVVAAALGVMSPYFRAFIIFAASALLPYSIAFYLEGGQFFYTLSAMFVLYLFAISLSGTNMHRSVRRSIELRLENTDLVKSLTDKNLQAEQARETAENANRSKSKFLAAASHDLRQPLHALGLFVDALKSKTINAEVKDLVDNISLSAESLNDLLNSLLDISRLDAGVLEPKITNFSLQPLLNRIRVNSAQAIADKGIEFHVDKRNFVVRSDQQMLERVLRNLVINATQYTKTGSISVVCEPHENALSIQVRDTGIGISKQNQAEIFAEFYQVGNPERDRAKGLGLGLAIVKRLIDLLHHKIQLKSELGQGSTFTVDIPLIATLDDAEPKTEEHDSVDTEFTSLAGVTILVIDDELIIRKAMQELLRGWDCEVVVAGGAEEAWEQLKSGAMNPDIILTDYRLRDNLTGVDAVKFLAEKGLPKVPTIIMTGDTAADRLQELKASGYEVLHKPVAAKKLQTMMTELID